MVLLSEKVVLITVRVPKVGHAYHGLSETRIGEPSYPRFVLGRSPAHRLDPADAWAAGHALDRAGVVSVTEAG